MASGCILGKCRYCDEFTWEDEEWDIDDVGIYHVECKSKDINPLSKYTNEELLNELIKRTRGVK